MASYKPYDRFASWDDIKEDYLMWKAEHKDELELESQINSFDGIGLLTVGMKGPIEIMKGFDENTSVGYYSLSENTLELYTKGKLLAAIVENISDEEFEEFQLSLPYGVKEI